MILIADSGSTKSTWRAVLPDGLSYEVHTSGINPVRDDEAAMRQVVQEACSSLSGEVHFGDDATFGAAFTSIHFYGAGCLPAFTAPLEKVLRAAFPKAKLTIESDLLGAAHALRGHREGIACILGTGSNSCLYDGRQIVRNVSPLGWILGDEGSGAVLGRLLVGDVLKGQLPDEVCQAFFQRFNLQRADIIEAVYRQPQANRFLASLVPFLSEHRDVDAVRRLLTDEFRRFFVRNVASYGRRDLPVGFIGSVAHYFRAELTAAAAAEGFAIGEILQDPMPRLVEYIQEDAQ